MNEIQPHQQRVVDEKAQLDERIKKLQTFIWGEKFDKLDRVEQDLMRQQLDAMHNYSTVLNNRLLFWGLIEE